MLCFLSVLNQKLRKQEESKLFLEKLIDNITDSDNPSNH